MVMQLFDSDGGVNLSNFQILVECKKVCKQTNRNSIIIVFYIPYRTGEKNKCKWQWHHCPMVRCNDVRSLTHLSQLPVGRQGKPSVQFLALLLRRSGCPLQIKLATPPWTS